MLPVEEFEDTKEAIRIRILKKNKQHNGQKKNNDLQNIQRSSNTNPLKTGGDLKCSGRVGSFSCKPFSPPVDKRYQKEKSRDNCIISLFNSKYKRRWINAAFL